MLGRVAEQLSAYRTPILSLPVSTAAFLLTQSPRVLDPKFYGWLWGSGDIATSFSQWLYFKEAPWLQWPITLNENYGFPWTKTIIYTDTPPLIALPMKLVASLVEVPIQFTGWQIFLSMYLLVAFSASFVRRVTDSLLLALSAGLLVAVSPMLIFRDVFYHYSLNILWVIPAAFFLTVRTSSDNALRWTLLAFVTLTWSPYFIVPVAILYSADVLTRLAQRIIGVRAVLKSCFLFLGGSLFALVIDGFWYNYSSSADFGLGYYNANLLALLNARATSSSSWSALVPGFPVATDGQYEGFAYLGAGALLLLVLGGLAWILRRPRDVPKLRPGAWLSLGLAATACFILSFGFTLTLGPTTLFALPIPEYMQGLLSIFRSSGRFMLVPGILLTLLAPVLCQLMMGRNAAVVLTVLCSGLTIWDARAGIDTNKSQQSVSWQEPRGMVEVGSLLESREIERITFIVPENSAYSWKMDIIGAAALRNIPVNDAFTARPNLAKLDKTRDHVYRRFLLAAPAERELWVLYPNQVETSSARLGELLMYNCGESFGDAYLITRGPCETAHSS